MQTASPGEGFTTTHAPTRSVHVLATAAVGDAHPPSFVPPLELPELLPLELPLDPPLELPLEPPLDPPLDPPLELPLELLPDPPELPPPSLPPSPPLLLLLVEEHAKRTPSAATPTTEPIEARMNPLLLAGSPANGPQSTRRRSSGSPDRVGACRRQVRSAVSSCR